MSNEANGRAASASRTTFVIGGNRVGRGSRSPQSLGAIKGAVEILEDELAKDSPRREFAQIAKTEVERIDRLVQEFFHFARAKEPNKQPTDANEIIRAVKLLVENQAAAQEVEISEELTDGLPLVLLDAEQIKQVLLNLAINSLQAMPDGGKLIFRSYQKDDKLLIETEDTGGGIEEATKSKIFDPFFTTKDKGLGMGLSVVYKTVNQHNGRIEVFDTSKGTRFLLEFGV
jgi:signal transduction histidine kinase